MGHSIFRWHTLITKWRIKWRMKFCACDRFVRSEGHVVRRSGSISGFNGNPLTGEAHDSRRDRQKPWLLEHTPRISRDQLEWRNQPRAMRHHAPHMASRATTRSPGESRSPRSSPLCGPEKRARPTRRSVAGPLTPAHRRAFLPDGPLKKASHQERLVAARAGPADPPAPDGRTCARTRFRSTVARSGLNTDGLISPASCQRRMEASPIAGRGRAWLVMAMITRSGRARW